jgi:DNA-binding transcriptional MocR family regulator
MHDTVARAMSHGVPGGKPWGASAKFLCPSPGYDRHFSVCEHFGIEMIPVSLDEHGPDMDAVEGLVAKDESIKGIWLVPRFNNPTGHTLADAVVERLAKMKTAAADFRIFWDNAYSVHTLVDDAPNVQNILDACKAAGNPDRPFLFGSTSKISFAGAGIAVMVGSEANMSWMRLHLSMSTIGPDKLNQLRHVRFFKDSAGIFAHMKRHADIIKPKFDAVERILSERLSSLGIATWTKPTGGYFVSFDTPKGCAKRVVELAKDAGVKLTSAGATFPYGKDPNDQNIRIAPTLPSLSEIETAMEVFAVCVKLAALEKL